MNTSTVNECILVQLPQNHQINGKITAINTNQDISFRLARIYYLYDVPAGEDRGGHAHKNLRQLIIAASGSFDIILDDGSEKKIYSLNRPFMGILMPPGIWRELCNFSSGSICLVLASEEYTELDYIRNYEDFLKYKKNE